MKFPMIMAAGTAVAVAVAGLAFSPPASSQGRPFQIVPGQTTPDAEGGNVVDVSVTYNFSVPLKDDTMAAQSETLESARRLLYGVAASECKVLMETIAKSCTLRRLNVQSNVQNRRAGKETVQVGGNASYRIGLK